MPRNGSGTYSLPSGNPVSAGTLIDATWANNTLNDLANEMTDSLSRSGEGGMLAPFRLSDGVQATPGLAWSNEPSTGFYRAGTNEMWAVVGGTQIQQFTATGTMARFAAGAVGTPSVTAYNDLNTGIYFPGADQLAIATAGVQRLLVDASGGVTFAAGTANGVLYLNGSKVATSGSALTFDGTTLGLTGRFNITAAANQRYSDFNTTSAGFGFSSYSYSGTAFGYISQASATFSGGSNTDFAIVGVNNLAFGTGTTEGMRLTSTGLGIGTTSPAQKLDVTGASNSVQARFGNVAGRGLTIGTTIITGTNDAGVVFDAPTASDGTLIFQTASVERARIDSSGNLGIGTSSPTTKLDVSSSSTTTLRVNRVGVADVYLTAGANGIYGLDTASTDLHFGVSNSLKMTLDGSGNLGLGVSPSAWSAFKAVQIGSGSLASTSTGHNVSVAANAYFDGSNWKYVDTAAATEYRQNGGAHFWALAASGTAGNNISWTQAMTLDADGDLGVGTTSPAAKLHVSSGASSTTQFLLGPATSSGDYAYVSWKNNSGSQELKLYSDAGFMSFYANAAERARITAAGGLAVGTTTDPGAGNIGLAAGKSLQYSSTAYITPEDNVFGARISAPGVVSFWTGSTPAERARITSGGDLLVGTTTYQNKRVTIDGGTSGGVWASCSTSANAVNVTYNSATTGDNVFEEFYTDGGPNLRGSISYNRGAGQVAYNVTSDVRLKDNIADAADAGDKVDALQVRQFDWKETGNHVDYGFVAQELDAVVPHAVSKPEDDEAMWSVDYSKLVPMLVKEIQSLRARVAALEGA